MTMPHPHPRYSKAKRLACCLARDFIESRPLLGRCVMVPQLRAELKVKNVRVSEVRCDVFENNAKRCIERFAEVGFARRCGSVSTICADVVE